MGPRPCPAALPRGLPRQPSAERRLTRRFPGAHCTFAAFGGLLLRLAGLRAPPRACPRVHLCSAPVSPPDLGRRRRLPVLRWRRDKFFVAAGLLFASAALGVVIWTLVFQGFSIDGFEVVRYVCVSLFGTSCLLSIVLCVFAIDL